MKTKLEVYEWLMLIFALCFLVMGGIVNYNGDKLQAAEIFANGAFLYSVFTWYEVRKANHKETNNDGE